MYAPPPRHIGSWAVAERNAADWMRYWGFSDARITGGGTDGGIDVISSTGIAQVKAEAHQTGAPALQCLAGARGLEHHKQLLFFSSFGYSSKALEYAAMMGMALFTYDHLGRPRAVSAAAHALMRRAAERETSTPCPGPTSTANAATTHPNQSTAGHLQAERISSFRSQFPALATLLSGQPHPWLRTPDPKHGAASRNAPGHGSTPGGQLGSSAHPANPLLTLAKRHWPVIVGSLFALATIIAIVQAASGNNPDVGWGDAAVGVTATATTFGGWAAYWCARRHWETASAEQLQPLVRALGTLHIFGSPNSSGTERDHPRG